jgi:hypothetical protein
LASGGDSMGGIQCLNLQGENRRSGLNWLRLAMTLFKVLFCESDFLRGENLWSVIMTMMALVHYSLLGGIVFGVDGFLVLFWWCLVRCYKEMFRIFFMHFFFIFWLCVSVLPLGYYVVAEFRCN